MELALRRISVLRHIGGIALLLFVAACSQKGRLYTDGCLCEMSDLSENALVVSALALAEYEKDGMITAGRHLCANKVPHHLVNEPDPLLYEVNLIENGELLDYTIEVDARNGTVLGFEGIIVEHWVEKVCETPVLCLMGCPGNVVEPAVPML